LAKEVGVGMVMRAWLFWAALLGAPVLLGPPVWADPVDYQIDPAHSQIGFSIDRFGFNHVLGRFDGRIDAHGNQIQAPDPAATSVISGDMMLDQAAPAHSSVRVVVQMAGYSSGNLARDNVIKGDHWLNVAQYPTMEFHSTQVVASDATHAQVTGDLTLMGQTHPLTLSVTLNRIGPAPPSQAQAAGFTATGVLKRSQWGLTTASALIGDDVAITIEALGVVHEAGSTPSPTHH
jgi:polyisoprenoid-binding protein YceI